MASHPEDSIAVPPPLDRLRRFALDGALLLFDRKTGLTAVCDGEETRHLVMRCPRVVQLAITNQCNRACTFCYRDVETRSAWTAESAFTLLSHLDRAGVLEVAFGGGEPLVFEGFVGLVERLGRETQLAVSVTTNGTLLTPTVARALAPWIGQIRVSLYDDVDVVPALRVLTESGARFGVNYLVTPERLPSLEIRILDLASRGCRDILLLAYHGDDVALHLSSDECRDLASRIGPLAQGLGQRMTLKLDACWGDRLEAVPQLFADGWGSAFGAMPCRAGREFVAITSDRRLLPCSFHQDSFPIDSADDLLAIWNAQTEALRAPARTPRCSRAPGHRVS